MIFTNFGLMIHLIIGFLYGFLGRLLISFLKKNIRSRNMFILISGLIGFLSGLIFVFYFSKLFFTGDYVSDFRVIVSTILMFLAPQTGYKILDIKSIIFNGSQD